MKGLERKCRIVSVRRENLPATALRIVVQEQMEMGWTLVCAVPGVNDANPRELQTHLVFMLIPSCEGVR